MSFIKHPGAAAVVAVLGLHLLAGAAVAQLPAARLSTVFPPGGQRGTSVEVTLTGTDLDEVTRLHVSGGGTNVFAEPKLDPATGKPVPNVFVVRIDRDAPPGAYDLRAVGRFGVTNPRVFVVDREPHAAAKPDNTTPQNPADVAVNAGAYAVAAAKGSQFFRVNLKGGRRVAIDVDSVEIDSRLDPVVVLYDAAGRELARDGQRGSVEHTPSSDGAYIVEVHDVLYRGGAEYFYRLRISDGRRIDYAQPPVARFGAITEMTLFGPAPSDREALRLLDAESDALALSARWYLSPVAAMLDGSQRYATSGAVNPLFLGATDLPLVAEQADNDSPAKAQPATTPVEVYGQFFPRGDHDWVGFDAKKNDAFWVEVISNRVTGGVTDPMVLVQRVTKDAKGAEQLADVREAYEPDNVPNMPRDFYAAHRDPAFRFVAPEDGAYRILVRDLFNDGGGVDDPRRVYRLSIAPAAQREDFRLVAWPQAPQPVVMHPPITQSWGSNLRPGGVMPVSVLAFRTGGYAGDIVLSAEGLPPGVTCPPVAMNGGTNAATLMLVADESARPWAGPVRIIGTATRGDAADASKFARTARAGTFVWTVPNQELEPLRSRVAQEFVVAVTGGEVDPIAVRPAEEKVWEESVAGKVEIPLKVTRRGAYAGPVSVKPTGPYPTVVALPEFVIAANTTDGKLALDFGALALPAGEQTIHLQATSTGPYDRDPALRNAAQAQKDAAAKATADLAAAVQKATEAVNAAKAANKPEDVAKAEKTLAEANEKVKQNEAAKTALAERIKTLQPKDTLAYAYSTPIRLKVTPAPITLAATPPVSVKPGGKVDVPVSVTRLYGFAGEIELTAAAPQGVAGLSAAAVKIPGNAAQGVLTVQAAVDAKPGEYTLALNAAAGQNGRPVRAGQPLKVTVAAP